MNMRRDLALYIHEQLLFCSYASEHFLLYFGPRESAGGKKKVRVSQLNVRYRTDEEVSRLLGFSL